MKETFICENIDINVEGHLTFAGRDTVSLAEQYKTPLYLLDEERIRHNCRVYTQMMQYFPEGSRVVYAGKACSFKKIYSIIGSEGLGIDVVSGGEIYTAYSAGADMSKAMFHSNNKTDEDIDFAMDCGVGYFVADSMEEIAAINTVAERRNVIQQILLRITPGIDPHTYAAINTGMVDSKFGAAIETGQAKDLTGFALSCNNIELVGFHCHVGSMVFAEDVYVRTVKVMLGFAKEMKDTFGFEMKIFDIGGGLGVRYVESDPVGDIPARLREMAEEIEVCCSELSLAKPAVFLEPGRSIVADAGMTLYTVGSVKRITGYKNYVSIDGGMADNPRFALYGAKYTVLPASKMLEKRELECSVAGRCCESGDKIQENVMMPDSVQRGDIIAVCTTGAYNYSMASNYNRLPKPPVIMLSKTGEYIAVKRETFADVARLDVL